MNVTTKKTAFRNESVFKAIRSAATEVAKVKASELTRMQTTPVLKPGSTTQGNLKRAS